MAGAQDIIDLIHSACTLKRVGRSGWSLVGVSCARSESVAEHTYGTIVASILISQHLIKKKVELDLARVAIMATIHDLPESVTSDIPRVSGIPEAAMLSEAKQRMEKTIMQQIFSRYETDSLPPLDLWMEYTNMSTLEARVVRGSDIIDMLVQALSLEESGVSPGILNQFFNSAHEIIEPLELDILNDIYSILLEKHRRNAERVGIKLDSR
jgi:5'-deoxynucleotidase YfbR-like HD superfamily hydrolase